MSIPDSRVQGTKLEEKETKNYGIKEISLERT